jgi:hypothetical protein
MHPLPLLQNNSINKANRLNLPDMFVSKTYTFKKWLIFANQTVLNDKYHLLLISQTFIDEPKDKYQLNP